MLAPLVLLGCTQDVPASPEAAAPVPSGVAIKVLAGSENKEIEPLLQQCAQQAGATVSVDYSGSVDIALKLESGTLDADAVLPASSFWVQFADKKRIVKNARSVMRSPVVFGVKRSVAESLGWVKNPDVKVHDILEAAQAGKLRFAMTSATQSNSGAAAYFGFLSAFAGSPEVLQVSHLEDPAVQENTRKLLATINRSSGSSGYLRNLMVEDEGRLDAMVNYEAMVISANRDLVAAGKEPLCAVYPTDGMAIADFPFGFVDHGDPAKAKAFDAMQQCMLSPGTRAAVEKLGRRAGTVGLEVSSPDPAVFNPDWCIDTTRVISPIPTPTTEVTERALELFQTLLRKPSYTVYVVDYSGSMANEGREQAMKDGMETVLEPQLARKYWLQPSAQDISVIIPFDTHPRSTWRVQGNDLMQLRGIIQQVKAEQVDGGTGLFEATVAGLSEIDAYAKAHPDRADKAHLSQYFPAVVLMTDGEGRDDPAVLQSFLAQHPEMGDIPIFGVKFGEAKADQLVSITGSDKNVFDGSKNLAGAIRQAKGNN